MKNRKAPLRSVSSIELPRRVLNLTPLSRAFGVATLEWVTFDVVVKAVVAVANGEFLPAGSPEQSEAVRAFARRVLVDAARGIPQLLDRLAQEGSEASRISAHPHLWPSSAANEWHPQIEWRLDGPDEPTPWVAFAGMLLAERALKGRTEIGHCKLQECGRFFQVVISGRGKPARQYCPGTNHRRLAEPKSTPRANRSREAKRKRAELEMGSQRRRRK